ncbi:MAG: retinol dehydrogenase 12 [Actinomycetota bacterium]|jgi:NAD(P)-dependent dehydrogenase (short-subunit alcohol dehydrogenase family)|nr:retinol dehydrogenase 12 [Actinomycetota bacterium]
MGDLSDKTFFVTGANTGIGRATAEALAQRGGKVVLACRSESRTAPVVDDIIAKTDNKAVEFLALDLGDLDSVRTAAASFLARDEPLHALINNAGLAGKRGQTTAQGFELTFGVNHLGHFLLTTLLLDRLRQTGSTRVVNVSSDSHYSAKGIDFDDLRRPTKGVGLSEYAVSKLANVLFTQELARRVPATEVSAYSLHPGVIASDIWRSVPWPVRPIMRLFMKSTEEGAATSLYCATSDEVAGQSGAFYVDCKRKDPNPVATPELAQELWSRSEAWTAA